MMLEHEQMVVIAIHAENLAKTKMVNYSFRSIDYSGKLVLRVVVADAVSHHLLLFYVIG